MGTRSRLRRRIDEDSVADLWVELMTRLDYRVFYAHGDDFGGSIVSRIAGRHPESILGLHVSEWLEPPAAAQHDLTSAERKYLLQYLLRLRDWREAERAYGTIAPPGPAASGWSASTWTFAPTSGESAAGTSWRSRIRTDSSMSCGASSSS
jgi:pimeloyl-ACP methyl ester carboxylesterase